MSALRHISTESNALAIVERWDSAYQAFTLDTLRPMGPWTYTATSKRDGARTVSSGYSNRGAALYAMRQLVEFVAGEVSR